MKADFVDGAPSEGAPDDVLTEGDHTDCGLEDGLIVVVLEEVPTRDVLKDVLTEEVPKMFPQKRRWMMYSLNSVSRRMFLKMMFFLRMFEMMNSAKMVLESSRRRGSRRGSCWRGSRRSSC